MTEPFSAADIARESGFGLRKVAGALRRLRRLGRCRDVGIEYGHLLYEFVVPVRHYPRCSCSRRKSRYPTEGDAWDALLRVARREHERGMNVYRCETFPYEWHIGHVPGAS